MRLFQLAALAGICIGASAEDALAFEHADGEKFDVAQHAAQPAAIRAENRAFNPKIGIVEDRMDVGRLQRDQVKPTDNDGDTMPSDGTIPNSHNGQPNHNNNHDNPYNGKSGISNGQKKPNGMNGNGNGNGSPKNHPGGGQLHQPANPMNGHHGHVQASTSTHPMAGHPGKGNDGSGHPVKGNPGNGHPMNGNPGKGHPKNGHPGMNHPGANHPAMTSKPANPMNGNPENGNHGTGHQGGNGHPGGSGHYGGNGHAMSTTIRPVPLTGHKHPVPGKPINGHNGKPPVGPIAADPHPGNTNGGIPNHQHAAQQAPGAVQGMAPQNFHLESNDSPAENAPQAPKEVHFHVRPVGGDSSCPATVTSTVTLPASTTTGMLCSLHLS